MAGLYAALLLKSRNVDVRVFEANPERVGGRVYTYRFTPETNQYFEAGAMRLPEIQEHQMVFDLIDYLNDNVRPESRITTIPYVLYDTDGNRVLVNGSHQADGQVMSLEYANRFPEQLGFGFGNRTRVRSAGDQLKHVLEPYLKALDVDFEAGFRKIIRYDHLSFGTYLRRVAHWSEDRINYLEVMTSQTNQFQHSFTEMVIESRDFGNATWRTIDGGMDRLPNACAEVLGADHIALGARVYRLEEREDGRTAIYHTRSNKPEVFDRVIIALPPAVLRMLERPRWSVQKEHAIRSLHFEPLYKIGLRFKTRFWEAVTRPSRGGQSITDLPSRWVVYPSYGIGDEGPGVLLLYSWMADAACWLPQPREDRVKIALRDLALLYEKEVDVNKLFIEAKDVAWAQEWATGDAMFLPGQFRRMWDVARQPEGYVYFAGEHLSVHHTWIVGALDSALTACRWLLFTHNLEPLRPTR
jgi:monoamine oxidase